MAATAYASLVSLLNTLDQIRTHPFVSTFFDVNRNNYLYEKVNFLVDFLEEYSDVESRKVEDLVRRIADAAHEAEDIVEVHAADRVRGGESPSLLTGLQRIIEEMESILEEVIKVIEEPGKSPSVLKDLPPSSSSSSSAPPANDEATTMVGFDDYAEKLMWDVTGHDVGRQIISITGMSGIGKTTLARNLYENSHVARNFNVRVWINVSQDSNARKVILQALSRLGGGFINIDTLDDQQLELQLYKYLYNRRYLIVLDDVWGVEIWDKIKFFFPENQNGSRIVVTTRESRLANDIGSSEIAITFLDEENSWKLFYKTTFPHEDFPPELEEAGRKSLQKCGGLPLGITAIGGLLGNSPRTQEYWEKVAKDKSLILDSGENKLLDILYLSYKYLPIWLKVCFLHFGLYLEDFEIVMSTIIKVWIGEGFIRENRGQSLEEVGERYLKELVDRNFLLLCASLTTRQKSCSIHDLLSDLCMNIGTRENFYYVQRSIDGYRHFIANQRTMRLYSQVSHASEMPTILYPLIVPAIERAAWFTTRLLRVFCCGSQSPYYGLNEVNMRFLRDFSFNVEHDYLLPSLVSRFWALQTLIVSTRREVVAPVEIWKMSQLRHIDVRRIYLPDPPPFSDDEVYILQNLQTLREASNLILTEGVCKRIPNIKELYISCDYGSQRAVWPFYRLENLDRFNKLQSLHYDCKYVGDSFLHMIGFPFSLKELTLSDCKFEWSYMGVIASLPRLEFLSIENNAFAGIEWAFVDEIFVSLKHLEIFNCGDLRRWIVESSNFPVLEELSMRYIWQLDGIPSSIVEIPTLRNITLTFCGESLNISTVEILHEQESFENLDLRVLIRHYGSEEAALFSEKIQELGLSCLNLKIEYCESYLIYFYSIYILLTMNEWGVDDAGNRT